MTIEAIMTMPISNPNSGANQFASTPGTR